MLRKLLKYEWQATSRVLLPLYGSVLVMAIINRLFWIINESSMRANNAGSISVGGLPTAIAGFLYGSLIVASFVVTFVLLIQRFYKSLLGDEGYLMFTLPVSVSQHIWVKTIVATIMCVLSGITTTLSVFILSFSVEGWLSLFELFPQMFQLMIKDPNNFFLLLEGMLWCIFLMVSGVLGMYLCIAIGHLAKRHRIAGAVGAYFGLSVVGQILMWFLIMFADATGLDFAIASLPYPAGMHIGMLLLNVLTVAVGAACFFFTRLILTRKLNLE